jgi:hypothetical protein
MKKSLLGVSLLTSFLFGLSNEETQMLELINLQKQKTNKSIFSFDKNLNQKAEKRNKYLETNINDFFTEKTDVELFGGENFSGIDISSRKIDRVNEIYFQKSDDIKKSFENIFNNPYLRNTLLNKSNNKIGISIGSKFITIYTSSDEFDKYCLKEKNEFQDSVCRKGDTNMPNSDVSKIVDSPDSKLRILYTNLFSITTFPYNKFDDFEIFSLNYKNTKHSSLEDSIISNPIYVNLGLSPDASNNKIYQFKYSLKDKNTGKEIPFKLIERNEVPSELEENKFFYNNNHYHYNFINYNDKIIQPLSLLDYNTNYVLTVSYESNPEIFKQLSEETSKELPPPNTFKWVQKQTKTFEFKTRNISKTNEEKVINIDNLGNTNEFELDKNKEYILYSKNFFTSSIQCDKNSIVTKLNYISYLFNNKGKSDICHINNNGEIINIKMQ